ncbi:MAG: DegT/DnrJ/EryC1/StrS family aminotransferase [Candidatus Aminicenantes bacterium]|nr:DegT/DnrJ/EryC1/StrS family aminotransferase [Candidatus Aminicenantes bacterium]
MEDSLKLQRMWREIFTSHQWTEGKFTSLFEEKWEKYCGIPSVAFSGWSGAAAASLDYFGLKGKTVLCPSNTFMATPLSIIKAGARVEFVDCGKDDLCIDPEDLKEKIEIHRPEAVFLVHIGGHISFHVEKIAEMCKKRKIILLEDCAHAHGAIWKNKRAGTWGDAGIYSFYATKTITTGEGGMLVSQNRGLIEFARKYRNYGKPDYKVEGSNFRMSEFTAAIGCVQVDRLDDIVAWKKNYAERVLNKRFPRRVRFPKGMTSGFYKYIVFDPIENSTGKVYDTPCHFLLRRKEKLPGCEWIAKNHWCVPIYYKGIEK